MIRKPYYLLYIPIMVTKMKFLNSNPVKLMLRDWVCGLLGEMAGP